MFSQLKGYFFPRTHNSVIDPNNGSTFQNIYIPDEVLELILSHVETRSLLACRRVCKKWQTLIDTQVLKMKAIHAGYTHGMDTETKNSMSWSMWYAMLSPFTCNLLKNPCGHNKLGDWDIIASGGDRWKIEEGPAGFAGDNIHLPYENKMKNYWTMREKPPSDFWKSKEKPKEYCFVTSFGVCAKQQIVSLARTKTMMDILDKFKPIIVYRDWYCRRFDCGGIYKLKVCLLDENKQPLAFQVHATTIDELNWQKVENKFENYPPGVRYVLFHHEGVDNQFWRGHYGPKMTESTVFMLPPGISYDINMENNLPIRTESEDQADLRMNFRNHRVDIEERGPWEDDEENMIDEEEEEEEEDEDEEVDNEFVGREYLIPAHLVTEEERRLFIQEEIRREEEEERERREEEGEERERERREEEGEEREEANDWDGIRDDLVPPPYEERRRGAGERERREGESERRGEGERERRGGERERRGEGERERREEGERERREGEKEEVNNVFVSRAHYVRHVLSEEERRAFIKKGMITEKELEEFDEEERKRREEEGEEERERRE